MSKQKSEALTPITKESAALTTIPDDIKQFAGAGSELIEQEHIQPPRLLLCQSGTPQRKRGDVKEISGLQELDIFNDLTEQIYGQSLKFAVIQSLGVHFVEFAPMDQGGGVIDRFVPPNDPRTKFTRDATGKTVRPVATEFRDYLVWLPDYSEFAAISFKSTQIKVSNKLNGLMKMPLRIGNEMFALPPTWARLFQVETAMQKRDNYSWGNYNLKLLGITSAEDRRVCAELYTQFRNARIEIVRDNADSPTVEPADGDDSFDPSQM